MVHCVLEFMDQAETLPDQRFGAVRHDQLAAVLPGGAAGPRQVNVGAHEDARQLGSWSESVLAQPDLGARTKESDSQFDSYYAAINSSEWLSRNRSQTPHPRFPSPVVPSHNETLVEEQ